VNASTYKQKGENIMNNLVKHSNRYNNGYDGLFTDFWPSLFGPRHLLSDSFVDDEKISTETLDDKHIYHFEVPGFAKEDLEIELDNSLLVIKGKKDKREVSYTLKVNDSLVDQENIEAVCLNGILSVTFPRKKEKIRRPILVK
jgi:HSP20 family molecular chaperone IbpA